MGVKMTGGRIQELSELLVSLRRREAVLDQALVQHATSAPNAAPDARMVRLEKRNQMTGVHRRAVLDQIAFAHPETDTDALILCVVAVALFDRISMASCNAVESDDHVRLHASLLSLLRYLEIASSTVVEATGLEFLVRSDWRELLGDDDECRHSIVR